MYDVEDAVHKYSKRSNVKQNFSNMYNFTLCRVYNTFISVSSISKNNGDMRRNCLLIKINLYNFE